MKTGVIIGISAGVLALGTGAYLIYKKVETANAETLEAIYDGETKKSVSRPTVSFKKGDSVTLKNSKDGKYAVYELNGKDLDPKEDFVLKSEIKNIKKFVKENVKVDTSNVPKK